MTELVFQGVAEGPIFGVNARLGPGRAVVLGVDPAALSTLVAVAAGVRAPGRGQVLLDGKAPFASPEMRRTTAALLADESLPPFRSLTGAVGAVLAARGESRSAHAVLDEVGLGDWKARRSRDLDAAERRTLLCALALTHPNPRLFALYEPLAAGRALSPDFVRTAIARAADAGAVVLVATQSLDDARALGGAPWVLEHGSLSSADHEPLVPPAGSDETFVVETTDARRLTMALARDTAVSGVRWSEEHAPNTLFVFGSDPEALASAIVRTSVEESIGIQRLALAPAPLEAVFAMRAQARATQNPYVSPYGALPYAGAPYAGAPYAAAPYAPPPYPGQPPPAPTGESATVAAGPGGPPQTAPAPADQSVGMPTEFADPTRPPRGGTS